MVQLISPLVGLYSKHNEKEKCLRNVMHIINEKNPDSELRFLTCDKSESYIEEKKSTGRVGHKQHNSSK